MFTFIMYSQTKHKVASCLLFLTLSNSRVVSFLRQRRGFIKKQGPATNLSAVRVISELVNIDKRLGLSPSGRFHLPHSVSIMTISAVLSLMFIIALCLKSEALASFPNGNAINSSSLAMDDRTMHSGCAISQDKMPRLKNIPEFLMKLYLQENAKDGLTSKAGKTTAGTVHGFVGRGNMWLGWRGVIPNDMSHN